MQKQLLSKNPVTPLVKYDYAVALFFIYHFPIQNAFAFFV